MKLLLIGAFLLVPVMASYLLYYYGGAPASTRNYGDLLDPRPLPDQGLRVAGGAPFRLSEFNGKWVMLQVDGGACGEECERKLYVMRQVRKTQGREMHRIERAWLIDDGVKPDPALVARYEGTWLIDARGVDLAAGLPATGSVRDHIYLLDPKGNVMMRFPRKADPSRMVRDLSRLLR